MNEDFKIPELTDTFSRASTGYWLAKFPHGAGEIKGEAWVPLSQTTCQILEALFDQELKMFARTIIDRNNARALKAASEEDMTGEGYVSNWYHGPSKPKS